jgi:SagB-type dehydrogenase family enzyme
VKSYGKTNNDHYSIPSAGGTYPLSMVLMINNVDGLKRGLYQYYPNEEIIVPLKNEKYILYDKITANLSFMRECVFSVHIIGNPELICYKYQDRGYRFMNLECGHLAQNLTLVGTTLGVSSVCSGGFLDGAFIEHLNSLTNNNLQDYLSLYEIYFGYEEL